MTVSKRLRYEILKRDNHACRYCGSIAPDVKLTIDHVTPLALGGTDLPENLVAACAGCNSGKTSIAPDAPLVADVAQDAVRWSAAMKLAAERLSKREDAVLKYMSTFEEAITEYEEMSHCTNAYHIEKPRTWRDSVEQFYRAGLPADQLVHALHVSMSRDNIGVWDKWRYMCGIAWKMVTEIQDEAKAILEEDSR